MTDELIAMAENTAISDAGFMGAFLFHYFPDGDHQYELLLYTMALHRPKVLLDFGIDVTYVRKKADFLHALHEQQQHRIAS
ncbi:MAG: hypothetical protein AAB445_02105 [Patescibacteria group bacterium]